MTLNPAGEDVHDYHPLCGCPKCFGVLPTPTTAIPDFRPLEPTEAARDRLWCESLIATLDIDAMNRVLREFDRRRRGGP